jgi:hypothetical protein
MFLHTRGGKLRRAGFYACTAFHKRGRAVCQNNLEVPMEPADRAVIAGIRDTVLRPAIVDAALEEVLTMLAEPSPRARTTEALEAELGAVSREIERLESAISEGPTSRRSSRAFAPGSAAVRMWPSSLPAPAGTRRSGSTRPNSVRSSVDA